jgi:hypothetical protein
MILMALNRLTHIKRRAVAHWFAQATPARYVGRVSASEGRMMHWGLMGVTIALAVAIDISIAPVIGPVVRFIWRAFWWLIELGLALARCGFGDCLPTSPSTPLASERHHARLARQPRGKVRGGAATAQAPGREKAP